MAMSPDEKEKQSPVTQEDEIEYSSPVLEWMKKNGVPLTRESYLNVAYMGNPPDELDAEEEAELPSQFQRWAE